MIKNQPERRFTGKPQDEPEFVGDIWDKLASGKPVERTDGFGSESERHASVAARDADDAVAILRAERAALISRREAGEPIDPDQLDHVGYLLLEAQMTNQALRQDQGLPPEE